MPGSDSDDAGGQRHIPEYGAENAQFVAEELGTQKFGDKVKSGGQQTGGDKAEQHRIDMHRTHSAEVNVFNIGHEVRRNQIGCGSQTESGCRGKPKCGCQHKCLGGPIACWHVLFFS